MHEIHHSPEEQLHKSFHIFVNERLYFLLNTIFQWNESEFGQTESTNVSIDNWIFTIYFIDFGDAGEIALIDFYLKNL